MKEHKLDLAKVEFDDAEYGIYKEEYYRDVHKKTVLDETTTIVPLEKDILFGAIIELDAGEDYDSRSPITMLKYRWTAPNEIKQYTEEHTRIVNLKRDIPFRFRLSEDHEQIEGEWKLEVESLDGTSIFSKTFKVVDSPKERPAVIPESSL